MEINSIYEGDNLEVMSKFPDKSVDLIYLDPPFFTGKNWEFIWKDKPEKRAFEDRWAGGIEHYTAWMEPRLRECHRLLKDTGTIYLHCDFRADAHLRIVMDNIFGKKNFQNEIIWAYRIQGAGKKKWPTKHDTILFYSKTNGYKFNPQYERLYYQKNFFDVKKDAEGRMYRDVLVRDVWDDINALISISKELLGYPTQKPVALLERIVKASSNKGDVVLDPFCGCGTTLIASQRLERRWIGIDVSPTACKLMQKRLKKDLSFSAPIISGAVDMKYVKKLNPYDFQNWVVVDKFLGTVSRTKSGDMGIDGLTPQITGGHPIQVKRSDDVGRNVIDNFETAMRRMNKKKGYIVAFSFGKGAFEEVARVKNQEGLDITLRTVQDLLDGKIE
jgi:DNA modification methylase